MCAATVADWPSVAGGPRAGSEQEPVVWVSRADATAYCKARGHRLPHSVEWQLAAQGTGAVQTLPAYRPRHSEGVPVRPSQRAL